MRRVLMVDMQTQTYEVLYNVAIFQIWYNSC